MPHSNETDFFVDRAEDRIDGIRGLALQNTPDTNDSHSHEPDLNQVPGRSPQKWVYPSVVAVLVIALAAVTALLIASNSNESDVTGSNAVAVPTSVQTTTPTQVPTATPTQFVMDSSGWQGTEARCDGGETPLVTARTADALVAICTGSQSPTYKGVYTVDGSAITITGVQSDGSAYYAANTNVEHRVTTTDLTVFSSGGSVLSQSEFIEYRGDSLSATQPTAAAPVPTGESEAVSPEPTGVPSTGDYNSDPNGTGAYGRYESYGEYSTHFQCLAFGTTTAVCRTLIEKYGPEAGN